MSSHAGGSGVNISSGVTGHESEDPHEENSNDEPYTPHLMAVRPQLRSADPAGRGRSSSVEQLGRLSLPGRKARRKTCAEDDRGRWREGNQVSEEERRSVERAEGRDRGKQRQWKTERTHGDGAQERCHSDMQLNCALEVGEGSNNLQGGQTCPRFICIGCSQTNTVSLIAQSPWSTVKPMSSSPPQLSIPSSSTPLQAQRLSLRTAAEGLHHYPPSSSREPDPLWLQVRDGTAQNHHSSEFGEEEEEDNDEVEGEDVEDGKEEGRGVMEVMSQTTTVAVVPHCRPFGERRMCKREKNRIKCLRRRQRRRERWRQSQLHESRQSSTENPTTSSSSSSSREDDEDVSTRDKEGYICAVCLDVYFSPYMCHPCSHIFCEPCLRTLAKSSPANTPCPLCRTIITHVFFQKELNQTTRTFFPKEYLSRKQIFQKASCAKWPLPSCRKLFRIFGGFQRQNSPIARRQFPHGGSFHQDTMDFEDDSQSWRFDMDMVIIYIYSVNWVIGFFIFCFLCYLFFPSF
ncbi:uncharacterized protein rnf180a [Solea solea]|uniref:uncharacterized protein rnf180a n=1 Tax=Solea solea TaxID=90069 RepID=UPI00272D05C3|nr:uncharacterized protein rnf180a [Solea solea]